MKTRPKGKWYYVSLSLSQEKAFQDMNAILDKAKIEDNDNIKACIQSFETGFYIPEFLAEVKEQKLLYN
jgi:hypothetical protein